jgi:hypothetical protein
MNSSWPTSWPTSSAFWIISLLRSVGTESAVSLTMWMRGVWRTLVKIFTTQGMAIFAMSFWPMPLYAAMLSFCDNSKMGRITACSIFAYMVQLFAQWNRTNKQTVGELMSTQLRAAYAHPSVSLVFTSGPVPALGDWINNDFVLNSNWEVTEHIPRILDVR